MIWPAPGLPLLGCGRLAACAARIARCLRGGGGCLLLFESRREVVTRAVRGDEACLQRGVLRGEEFLDDLLLVALLLQGGLCGGEVGTQRVEFLDVSIVGLICLIKEFLPARDVHWVVRHEHGFELARSCSVSHVGTDGSETDEIFQLTDPHLSCFYRRRDLIDISLDLVEAAFRVGELRGVRVRFRLCFRDLLARSFEIRRGVGADNRSRRDLRHDKYGAQREQKPTERRAQQRASPERSLAANLENLSGTARTASRPRTLFRRDRRSRHEPRGRPRRHTPPPSMG